MSRLMKWTEVMKGKGITVIDNTDTLPEVDDEFQIPDPPVVQNGKYKRTQVVPMSEVADTQARQDEVDAALDRAKAADEAARQTEVENVLAVAQAAREATYEIDPSQPVSFGDLANMAEGVDAEAENTLVVTKIEKVFDSTEPQSWDDLVAGTLTPEQENVPDFPPETPIVYVSLDVPEGVEVIFRLNGQELL